MLEKYFWFEQVAFLYAASKPKLGRKLRGKGKRVMVYVYVRERQTS